LIICEDEKSAVYYLRGFNIPPDYAEVVTLGGAGNTYFLVEKALDEESKPSTTGHRMPLSGV
jgi:hypothetical protein